MIRKNMPDYFTNPVSVAEAERLMALAPIMEKNHMRAKMVCWSISLIAVLCFFVIGLTDNFFERAAELLGLHEVCVRGIPVAVMLMFVTAFYSDGVIFRLLMRKHQFDVKIGEKLHFDSGNYEHVSLVSPVKINTGNLPVKGSARDLYRAVTAQGRDLLEFEVNMMQEYSMLRNFLARVTQKVRKMDI